MSARDSTLVVGGIRRSVAFFPSGGDGLYGSIYESVDPAEIAPVVLSPSWGDYLVGTLQFGHELAILIAEAGGAALVYHPPGMGDSLGDPGRLTLGRLAEAAADAAAHMGEHTGRQARMAGIRLGALAVGPAASRHGLDSLLLIQPLLEPTVALASLRKAGATVESSAEHMAAAVAALDIPGSVTAVYYATPSPRAMPEAVERSVVAGDWRHSQSRAEDLAPPILAWLRSPRGEAA